MPLPAARYVTHTQEDRGTETQRERAWPGPELLLTIPPRTKAKGRDAAKARRTRGLGCGPVIPSKTTIKNCEPWRNLPSTEVPSGICNSQTEGSDLLQFSLRSPRWRALNQNTSCTPMHKARLGFVLTAAQISVLLKAIWIWPANKP